MSCKGCPFKKEYYSGIYFLGQDYHNCPSFDKPKITDKELWRRIESGEAIRTKTENTLQDTVWGCYHYGVSCADPNCIGFDIVPRYRTYASADEAWNRRATDDH